MGRATAHLFADEGANVVVVDVGAARVDAIVDEITMAGGSALGIVADLADAAQIPTIVEKTVERFGGIDILVNNAGVSHLGGATTPEADF